MVLNEIVRGAAGLDVSAEGQGAAVTQEDLEAAVASVLDEYTSLNNWHLMTASEETDRDRQDQQVTMSLIFCPKVGFYFVTI